MLRAFFDESTGSDEAVARYYVIAGYVGRLDHWLEFHRSWKDALAQSRVESFHATDCEGGYKAFHHLRGKVHDSERLLIQMRFANSVKPHGLVGVSVTISLRQHRAFENGLPAAKGQRHMTVPHMLAFRAFLQFVTQVAEDAGSDELVEFVGSDGPYSGRMRELFTEFRKHVSSSWMRRIAGFDIARSKDVPALQAADHLAYETWRERENPGRNRPQMEVLQALGQVKAHLLNRRFYEQLDQNTKRVVSTLAAKNS
jgi:hypothetical protein